MAQPNVAVRYAAALYELSAAAHATDAVGQDLVLLRSLWESDEELRAFLVHPLVSAEEKVRALRAALAGSVHTYTLNALAVMVGHGRASLIPELASLFLRAAEERGRLVYVRVRTARPLDPAHLAQLKATLAAALGKEVAVESEDSPELLAGAELEVRGKRLDFSAWGRLARLKERLKG